jgi:hypothetical protein
MVVAENLIKLALNPQEHSNSFPYHLKSPNMRPETPSQQPKMVKKRFKALGFHDSGWKPHEIGLEPSRSLELITLTPGIS